jgi:hypothetical protein
VVVETASNGEEAAERVKGGSFVVPFFAAVFDSLGCAGSVSGSPNRDASTEASTQTEKPSPTSGCSVASPCSAGDGGCPVNLVPYPADGDPCTAPGLACYGYGSFSCPLTLTCLANGTWQVSCPDHPSGLDSGSCGCTHVTPSGGGSSGASSCSSDVALGCSCPTTDDGGTCVCTCLSMPECPASLQTSSPAACDHAGSCMNCLGGASGIICNCSDAGVPGGDGGSSYWQCIPTEEACTGGTFHG